MRQARKRAQYDLYRHWYGKERKEVEERLNVLMQNLAYPDPPAVSSAPLMADVAHQALISNEGGKRLRALLLISTWQLAHHFFIHRHSDSSLALAQTTVKDLACSIEIFQTGALVHDDIMDDSDERRGKPSAHRALAEATLDFSPAPLSTQRARQSGMGLGIMLGDLLATLSLRVAEQAIRPTSGGKALPIIDRFLLMQQDVEIGQVLDEANSLVPLDNVEALVKNCQTIYARKTASYTCVTPITIGLLAAGMSPRHADAWGRAIGRPLGIAFQISDDLKDVIPSHTPTGKPLLGDVREGKRTILLADTLRLARNNEKQELIRLYTSTARSEEDVKSIQRLFIESGAIDASFKRLARLGKIVKQEANNLITALGENTQEKQLNNDFTVCWKMLLGNFFVSGNAHELE